MLTASWAALGEHSVGEQSTGHWGKRSRLRECSRNTPQAPRLSPLRALHWHWAPSTVPAGCCEHSSHHRNPNTELSTESRLCEHGLPCKCRLEQTQGAP